VPPEVTVADLDVEVGVVVVVVVAGVVVVVVASDDDEVPSSDVVVGVVVVTAEDVEPSLDDVVVVVELDAALLAPGCFLGHHYSDQSRRCSGCYHGRTGHAPKAHFGSLARVG
jgi:hypothetical protein